MVFDPVKMQQATPTEFQATQSLPQPHEISSREKEQSLAAYFMMFVSVGIGFPLPLINVFASLLYFYFTKTTSSFVYFHSFQSLVSQIAVSLINAAAVSLVVYSVFVVRDIVPWIAVYWGCALLANLAYFIVSLIAAIQAFRGNMFYFWFFGKWAYRRAFLRSYNPEVVRQNLPPR